jgi:DHA1 family tetracycline resistance protein-like MFS transporter
MGIVADIVPEEKRAQWVGIVMGSYGFGFIFGPILGGILYDGWGFTAPFLTSAVLAFIAFIAAAIMVPETRTQDVQRREVLRRRRAAAAAPEAASLEAESLWTFLPRPLYVFGTLLALDFIGSFAFAFVEPQMVFYFYEELDWSTVQFGIVVGAYGLVMVIGQTALGQLSDRFGRKPVIIAGTLLMVTFYAGLVFATTFSLLMLVAVVAGLGAALTAPAVSAYYLDITAEQHRSRVLGIKGAATSLGSVTGPLLVVGVSAVTTPQGVFAIAGVLIVFQTILAFIFLKEPGRSEKEPEDLAWAISSQRALAAQAALRGVALSARTARQLRRPAGDELPGLQSSAG